MSQNNLEPQDDDTINTEQPLIPNNNDETNSSEDIKSVQKKVGEITQFIDSHKDEALAKYVVGMVNAIAGKYLTPEDKEKAIGKLNKATSQSNTEPNTSEPIIQSGTQENSVAESINIDEIIDEVLSNKNKTPIINKNKKLKDKIFKPSFL